MLKTSSCQLEFVLCVGANHANILHEGSEAFVEPQVVPPAHRDEIAEPLANKQLIRIKNMLCT